MSEYRLDPDAAFGFLVRTSSPANTKGARHRAQMIKHHLAEIRDLNPLRKG